MSGPGTEPAAEQRADRADQDFGQAAAEDQERVDRLEAEGMDEEDLPDESEREPRAGRKAEPEA